MNKRELDVAKLALQAAVDPPPAHGTWIGDHSFMEQLARLKALRQFLLVEGFGEPGRYLSACSQMSASRRVDACPTRMIGAPWRAARRGCIPI